MRLNTQSIRLQRTGRSEGELLAFVWYSCGVELQFQNDKCAAPCTRVQRFQ
jgi:hypothetical protein